MSDAVWFHLIDTTGEVIKSLSNSLLGPIVVAICAGITVWWRSRVTAASLAKKVDDTASALAVKTDEQTKVLNDRNDKQDQKLETIGNQTNGLTAALIQDAGEKAFRAGGDAERANPTQPK